MVDYRKALKRPFSDIKKLLIAILISIVPIVNFMFTGYILDVAKTAMKKKYELPEWNYKTNFVQGFISLIISLVYMIPFLVLVLLAILVVVLLKDKTLWIVLVILIFIIAAVIYSIYLVGVTMRYAETRKFKSAFEISKIAKKVFHGKFLVTLFVAGILSVGIAVLVSMLSALVIIPFVSLVISMAIGTVISIFMYTALGQAYAEN